MRALAVLVRVVVIALLAGLFQAVTVTPASATVPNGVVDSLSSPAPGRINAAGWAFDYDDPSRYVDIHVYVGGYGMNTGGAMLYRPDVHAVYGTGEYHGYDATFDVPVVGDLAWEVYGIDPQGGPPALLGQGRVTVADPSPTGAVDPITSPAHRTVKMSGWASDPNATTTPVKIEAYIGGTFSTPGVEFHPLTANAARSDGRLGFSGQFTTAKTGKQDVYVYAKNVPGTPGADRLIGVVPVTIYVDTAPPDTTITEIPKVATPSDLIQVKFSSSEANSTFQCRWDAATFTACPSTGASISLTPGEHTFAVRATDAYGNTDPMPATALVVVTAAVTAPPPPGQPGPETRTVGVRAAKKKSKLFINVDPDSADTNHAFVIQRKVGKKWRTVKKGRTRGAKDTAVINLKRGTYRVKLRKDDRWPAQTSRAVRLKR